MKWNVFWVFALASVVVAASAETGYLERMEQENNEEAAIHAVAIVDDANCEHPIELYNPANAIERFGYYGSGIALSKVMDEFGMGVGRAADWDVLLALIKDLDWINPGLEVKIGGALYEKMEKEGGIIEDAGLNHGLYERLREITGPIITSVPAGALPYDIKVFIVNDDGSFSTPGGYIYISKSDLAYSDDALAFIIAHELSHVTKRHTIRMYEARIGELMSLPMLMKYMGTGGKDASGIIGLVVGLKKYDADYNVDQEHQADVCAIRYLTASGWGAAKAARAFLRKEQQVSVHTQSDDGWQASMEQLMRTHPTYADRAEVLQNAVNYYTQHDANISASGVRLTAAYKQGETDRGTKRVAGAIGAMVKGVGSIIGKGVKGVTSLLPKRSREPSDKSQ